MSQEDPYILPEGKAPKTRAIPLLGRLWRGYLQQHWPWLLAATSLMFVEGSTLGILSYSLQPMFDRVLIGRDADAIWLIGGGIMALFIIRAMAGFGQRVILVRVGQISTTSLQTDLVDHLVSLDSQFFHENAPGALIERVQGDTAAVQTVWQSLFQGAARDVISLFALGIVAIPIDPVWTLTALIGIPILVLPSMLLQRYLRSKAHTMREVASQRAVRLSEIFNGIDLIKLNHLEDFQLDRFRAIVKRIVEIRIKAAGGSAMLPGLLDVMTGVGFFAVLFFGGQEILSGEKSVGQFMSFFTAMALAFQPMRRLASLAGLMQTTAASLDRIFSVLDLKPRIVQPETPVALPDDTRIEFQDVHFAYGDAPVLNGTSFVAEAGETTALVGPSGAGKSTIFNMLTRLIEPSSGDVLVGDTPVRALALHDLRGLFSVVAQEAPLFDETLRENIVLNRQVSGAELADVLDSANMTEVVQAMPNGLQTRAGPRGSNLSGGQRQRVAIARAIIRDTPILLLDEATSALDAQSEATIQTALSRLSEGRTILVIAHRLATVRSADKIVVMDKGRVVEEGTHDALLEQDGLYAALHRLQFRDD